MKDKVIFWLNADLLGFGIAKFFQEKYDCDLFAIIDITNKPKKFFKQQDFINFKKIWFYHDHILKSNKKPNLEYLISIEKQYKINLWLLAYNERLFYRFNHYYKFSEIEILSILEQECRLFETILDEINPDFLIMGMTNFQHEHVFYAMCQVRGVKILMGRPTPFAYKNIISREVSKVDDLEYYTDIPNRTLSELQDYLKRYSASKPGEEYKRKFLSSKIKLLKAVFDFIKSDNSNEKTHYTYFGRTKFRVLYKSFVYSLKKHYREFFINKHLSYDINTESPFIYFPLHIDEERILLIGAPFYTNQLEVITNIVKSLPVGYRLYIKEHPLQSVRCWRRPSFYKQIMSLPNVKLIHPSVKNEELLKKCSLVITISGTSSLEATFYEKPSIVFADMDFNILPSICRLKTLEDLPEVIKKSLETKVNLLDLNRYVNLIDKNSFEYDFTKLNMDMNEYFYYGGFLVTLDITKEKMRSFLEHYKDAFELTATAFVKKIQYYKKIELEKN